MNCRNPDFVSQFHFRVGCVSLFQSRVGGEDAGHVVTAAVLNTKAQYVSAEGEVVVTTLGDLDGDRAVRGLPVRRIRSAAGQRHYPGLFWSATTGGHVWYESRLELDRLWLADFDPDVVWIATQPVWLCGTDGSLGVSCGDGCAARPAERQARDRRRMPIGIR